MNLFTVSQMIRDGTLKFLARDALPSTKWLAPTTSIIKPTTIKRIIIIIMTVW
ncbi:hypothetical protein [Pseudobutyrivibrio sp. ACV-2]|uniref:hypothetical protein n=1 Tax=Pseudobutyrivibrio sp. ACV-2 TaxID=1520801 RepID=UPI00147F9AC1|nr:hypothetical protein [Pseudobutyrivibrio sp. ACV-2]